MRDPQLAAETDICVKCGLCLPHCPTYLKTQDENESPRGRLSLIQGWARDELPPTPALLEHIDNCLLCRACESACPAYVPYGRIVDRFRGETGAAAHGQALAPRLKKAVIRAALTRAPLATISDRLLSGSARGVTTALARLAGAGEMTAGLPPADAAPLPAPGLHRPPQGPVRGSVELFLGCTAGLADRATVQAAMTVLHRLGLAVDIPAGQTCCGALEQHAGEPAAASERIRENLHAFAADQDAPPIVSFASGCGAMLREYDRDDASDAARAFSRRVLDISEFLAGQAWPEGLAVKPLPHTVCLHAPCSLRHVLRADRHALTLLGRIPELKVVPLPAQTRCCGAAGSYLIDHPGMANALREDILDAIAATRPALLLTSNPGCAMHLRAGLRERGLADIEVLHPVTLLARQLG